ncbi:MAG: carboxypeptidase-like regulatory domain-containing protein [Candidatus Thiodiazotropha lotti]|nr:carboxypeptidase-like regulatory domain-containing protein [Candidatus Thiodiazotropha lotti]MCW4222415.1 carboxypeptidase-like regulatory domain-containing protein [Candidatus Thiodiazotropha lotti]
MLANSRPFALLIFSLLFLLDTGTVSAVGSLSGTITEHGTNTPMQGIQVLLHSEVHPHASVLTDADGRYLFTHVEPGQYNVHILSFEDSSGRRFVETYLDNVQVFDNAETVDMDLEMHQAGFIWGYVRTDSGIPIPGARVYAHAEWYKDGHGWHSAYTDETGLYRIWTLPSPGEFYVVSTRGGYIGTMPDITDYVATIAPGLYQATIPGVRGPDFALAEGGCIRGRVVNDQGEGIPGVRIWPHVGFLDIPRTRTDSDGHYTIAPLPATDQAYAYIKPGDLPPVLLNGVKYGSGERFVGPLTVTPWGTTGACTDAPEMVMLPSGAIAGVVTDTAGTPIVGVEIEIEGFDSDGSELDESELPSTDALGQYTLDYVPPGEYTLRATKDDWVMTSRSGIVVVSGQQTDLDLVMHRAGQATSVTGRVIDYQRNGCQADSMGAILPNYLDNWYSSAAGRTCGHGIIAIPSDFIYRPQEPFALLGITKIDDGYTGYFLPDPAENAGDYRLALPPGNVNGLLFSEHQTDYGMYIVFHDHQRWRLAEGETLTGQDFHMPPINDTGVLEGVISYPANAGFNPRMTDIIAFNEEASLGSGIGDALTWLKFAPAYRIGHLPAGRYTLRVLSHGFVDQTIEGVAVTSGATTVRDINLEVGATLNGLITDAVTGLPLEGVRVEITENGTTEVSDVSGAYAVSGLTSGSYNLLASKPGYADYNAVVSVNLPTTSYDIALDSQVGSISGRVVDGAATAVNGAQVVAYNPHLDSHETGITVGGDFTIGDLPAGDYVLGIHAAGYTAVQYPPSGLLTLSPDQGLVLTDPILVAPTPPLFDSASTVSEAGAVRTLSVTLTSDQPLLSPPSIVARGSVTTAGCNSLVIQQITTSNYVANCEVAAGEELVWIDMNEGIPSVIAGDPASASFSYEVAGDLLSSSSTNFFNAVGGDTSIMGIQDNTQVYLPPFALAGTDTQAVRLTVRRYGDPGDAATNSDDQTVSAVYDFFFEDDEVRIDTNHRVTITLQFEKPADMTEAAFEADLNIGYFRVSDQQWVYHTDADSGISNIRINWLTNTITFNASHFTRFAAFLPASQVIPGDFDGDGDVDRNDLEYILQDRNITVEESSCGSDCDLDNDGVITMLDARKLVLLCSRTRCATE